MIEVRLFATFRNGREKILLLDAAVFPNAKTVAEHLGIALDEIAILLINGRHSTPEAPIKDGDVVALFPPVGGG